MAGNALCVSIINNALFFLFSIKASSLLVHMALTEGLFYLARKYLTESVGLLFKNFKVCIYVCMQIKHFRWIDTQ